MIDYRAITILLVEDDPGQARLIRKNLRRSGISNEIVCLDDGQKAVDFLFHQGAYIEDAVEDPLRRPFLVLLDLNLPVLDGYQVLKRIKSDDRTRHIPVIVLTTTDSPYEIARSYELGCNVYITKPVEYDKFCEAIRRLGLFMEIVAFPDVAGRGTLTR